MSGVNVCGIDASTKSSGIALLSDSGELLDYALVQHNNPNVETRIDQMIMSLTERLTDWNPSYVFMEDSWNKLNVETSKKLTMIIGAVNYWCLLNNKWFVKLLPSAWRSQIGIKTGKNVKRNELKEKAIEYVSTQFNINVNDDVAESIGLAMAGLDMINNDFFERGD